MRLALGSAPQALARPIRHPPGKESCRVREECDVGLCVFIGAGPLGCVLCSPRADFSLFRVPEDAWAGSLPLMACRSPKGVTCGGTGFCSRER